MNRRDFVYKPKSTTSKHNPNQTKCPHPPPHTTQIPGPGAARQGALLRLARPRHHLLHRLHPHRGHRRQVRLWGSVLWCWYLLVEGTVRPFFPKCVHTYTRDHWLNAPSTPPPKQVRHPLHPPHPAVPGLVLHAHRRRRAVRRPVPRPDGAFLDFFKRLVSIARVWSVKSMNGWMDGRPDGLTCLDDRAHGPKVSPSPPQPIHNRTCTRRRACWGRPSSSSASYSRTASCCATSWVRGWARAFVPGVPGVHGNSLARVAGSC